LTTDTKGKVRLAVFDVEGVLIPKNRFLFETGKSLGFRKLLRILFIGFMYQAGLLQLESALKLIFLNMRGMTRGEVLKIFQKIPIMPKVQEVFTRLREQGVKTALISSGIPDFAVQELARTLGADYAFGVEVELNGDALTGEISGDAIKREGKADVLSWILTTEHVKSVDCIVVADDRNNLSMFVPGVVRIGYNPDFLVRAKADKIMTGKLTKILPMVEGKTARRELPSTRDILREAIHASGFFIPVLCIFFGKLSISLMISVVIAFYLASELLRLWRKNLPVISDITRLAASQTEIYDFVAAPLYFGFGILLTLVLFSPPASYAAIACFALGDSMASIFGGYFGRTVLPINRIKTLEGSLAGLFFAFLAGSVFVSPFFALAGAAAAMIFEWLPLPLNDNILIPLCTALVLSLII
jgi:HAD superfamily phosphoserine phosphatase-like hydrolase